MSTARCLLDRERELSALDSALRSCRYGSGTMLVVEGQAGLGKTAMLSAAAASADRAGCDVLAARGVRLERAFAFGVALQLFGPLLARMCRSQWEQTFAGVAQHAESLFSVGPRSTSETDFALLHALYGLTVNLCGYGPLLICVDDLQWADEQSLRFLQYLAERLDLVPVALVVSVRSGERCAREEELLEFGRTPRAKELRLQPLSPSSGHRLVRARLPAADVVFAQACQRASHGNPFLLCELLADVEARHVEPTALSAEAIMSLGPASVVRWTSLRLQELTPGSAQLARAVAVLGRDASLGASAIVAELEPDVARRAADTLRSAGILEQGDPLRFVEPLLGSSVYAGLTASERAGAHRRAAPLLAGNGAMHGAVAEHLLAAAHDHDAWTVQRLLEAASEALHRGEPRAAVRYLRRALAEPPPPDLRARVLLGLGEAEARMGMPEARGRLEEALALTDGRRAKADVLSNLGWVMHSQGASREAADVFERGLHVLGEADRTLASELSAGYVAASVMNPGCAQKARARSEEILADDTRSIADRPCLLPAVMAGRLFSNAGSSDIVALARRMPASPERLDHHGPRGTMDSLAARCLSWSDALEMSERVCCEELEVARRSGSELAAAEALCARAAPRYWMGRLAEAVADARSALEVPGCSTLRVRAAYWLALAQIELDELDEAGAALELGVGNPDESPTGWHALLLAARGRLAMARGDVKLALDELLAAGESLQPITANPAILPWRSEAALAANRVGSAAFARGLADEEVQLARCFGAARPLGVALRAAGLIRRDGTGLDLLREAVATLERSPAKLELTRVLVDLGAALRRSGHRVKARDCLREGLELAETLGAVALARRARDELLAAGSQRTRRPPSGPGSLTPGERRVTELAAGGLTNREIADALFVTRKAVRFHLCNAYRKLDISTREELPAVTATAQRSANR